MAVIPEDIQTAVLLVFATIAIFVIVACAEWDDYKQQQAKQRAREEQLRSETHIQLGTIAALLAMRDEAMRTRLHANLNRDNRHNNHGIDDMSDGGDNCTNHCGRCVDVADESDHDDTHRYPS